MHACNINVEERRQISYRIRSYVFLFIHQNTGALSADDDTIEEMLESHGKQYRLNSDRATRHDGEKCVRKITNGSPHYGLVLFSDPSGYPLDRAELLRGEKHVALVVGREFFVALIRLRHAAARGMPASRSRRSMLRRTR